MYAVIFKAQVNEFDDGYFAMAKKTRDLAINEYGCTDFVSTTEGDCELAISYWPSKESIVAWKQNPEHQQAQALGKSKWYQSYQVQVVEVLHEYGSAK